MKLILSSYFVFFGPLLLSNTAEVAHGRGHTRHRDDRKSVTVDEGGDAVIDCIPSKGAKSHPGEDEITYGPDSDGSIGDTGTIWKKGGKPLNVYDNHRYLSEPDKLVIKRVTIADAGLYQCFSSVVGLSGGRLIHLEIKEKLKFIDPQTDRKLQLNSLSKLHCKTSGYLPQTVTWIKNGAASLSDHIKQEKSNLIFNGVQLTDAGKYTCIASDSMTTINSTVNVEVVKAPKFIKKPPESMEAQLGSFIEIHCAADGDPVPIIHWTKNNKFVDFKTDQRIGSFPNGSLLINNLQQSDEGKYGCIAGSSAGFERAEVNLAIGTRTSSSSNISPTGYSASSTNEMSGKETGTTKTVLITGAAATLYMLFVLILLIWCRYRSAKRKAASVAFSNGNKPENGDLEMKERKSLTSQ